MDKEKAKKQFYEMTRNLGIVHTFSFDEMWEFLVMKRQQRDNFRRNIMAFDKRFKEHPSVLTKKEDLNKMNPLKHTFTDGICVREITNPKGALIITKIHKREHPYFLLKGDMSILSESGTVRIKAPYYGITPVGTKRIIYTHEECVFCTIHATDIKDIDELEKEFFTEDFKDIIAKEEICPE